MVRRKRRKRRVEPKTDWGRVIAFVPEIFKRYGKVTLRQIFYICVEHDLLKNSENQYKSLSSYLVSARKEGLVDDNMILDRGRPRFLHFDEAFWRGQKVYVELAIEKDTLRGFFLPLCKRYDINLLITRGYSSWTVKRELASRIAEVPEGFDRKLVLCFTDFDPSGQDLYRDLKDQVQEVNPNIEFKKILLTFGDVQKYGLPPKPPKRSDPRTRKFVKRFGKYAYEIEALHPNELKRRIHEAILKYIDVSKRSKQEIEELVNMEAQRQVELGLREIKRMLLAEIMPSLTGTLKTTPEQVAKSIKEAKEISLVYDRSLVQNLIREKLEPILV